MSSTTTSAGTLSYASAGGANAISFSQTTGSATLSYTGSGQTMSGAITASALTTGTITLAASGSGAINYSNAGSLGSAGSGNKNLILSGTNAGDNILAGQWVNNTGGAATLAKNGTGTWVLTGTNTYTGATNVNQGTLIVGVGGVGSTAAGSAVTVASNATLGGSGTIGGTLAVSGSIAPGNSIGTLNVGNNVTWNAGNAWKFELGASDSADLLNITGDFTKGTGSGWTFDFLNSDDLGTFTLVSWTGTTAFAATDFTAINYDGSITGVFSITSATNGSLLFTAIPEPSTALAGLLLGFGLLRRRRSA
jgi:fibronectin-binding autotransporter adhesin